MDVFFFLRATPLLLVLCLIWCGFRMLFSFYYGSPAASTGPENVGFRGLSRQTLSPKRPKRIVNPKLNPKRPQILNPAGV